MKKRILALILCVALCISFGSIASAASGDKSNATVTTKSDKVDKSANADEKIREKAAKILTKDDLFISKQAASYIAQMFIADMVNTQTTHWDTKTHTEKTVTMYDATNTDTITAYTIELNSGYVVVAAYVDAPAIILEWSDVAAPIYQTANLGKNDKVVYVGALDYFVDDGGNTVTSVDGIDVPRTDVNNELAEQSSLDNVPNDLLADIVEEKTAEIAPSVTSAFAQTTAARGLGAIVPLSNTAGSDISDPYIHAQNIYGGTWTCYEFSNNWESYVNFAMTSDFSGYVNHCGPTAITNLMKMYGKKYGSSINSASSADVFNQVMAANSSAVLPYYISSFLGMDGTGGTSNARADGFIKDSFARYNVKVTIYGRYPCSYDNIKNALTSSNRLLYVMLAGHSYYGNHAVVAYAYARLYNASNSLYKSYVKIVDGLARSARYLDMGVIASDQYWEVYF